MQPVITPSEMAAVDAAADIPVSELIERAGWATAREAVRLLGGTYGRRVTIIAGKGNNGADGRVAGRLLAARGVRVAVVPPGEQLPPSDLLIDAAFGTGIRGPWSVPEAPEAPLVLAVDIPSGIDGDTGFDYGSLQADRTITFAAFVPGLLLGAGAERAGTVIVDNLGLNTSGASAWLVDDGDLFAHLARNRRQRESHKWQRGVAVVAGSAAMPGAGVLAAAAAMRAGAGIVVHGTPGRAAVGVVTTPEAVARDLSDADWPTALITELTRFKALLIGPGLGTEEATLLGAQKVLAGSYLPAVVDADGLAAVANQPHLTASRSALTVLTPHDGEFRLLMGELPSGDRMAAVRSAASTYGCVVLLKGPTTLIANPEGRVFVVTSGDPRLATAGSGDVLAGMIAARLSAEASIESVAAAAHWHGLIASASGRQGLVASDLIEHLGDPVAGVREVSHD
jgi:ADP-dependent NAD(P)H-hydrate dehydratase / NAD(P)H-hydrate epimerase